MLEWPSFPQVTGGLPFDQLKAQSLIFPKLRPLIPKCHAPRLRSKTPRVRIKLVLLLLTVLSPVGCASNSANPEGKGKRSGMPEITINAPEKKVQATIHF
jgi:hypothetical protein